MKTGDKIKYLREQKKITQAELADKLKTTPQTIYKYEQGIITNIPISKIEQMANILDTTPNYLTGWDDEPNTNELLPETSNIANIFPVKTKKIPLLGKIACGEPIFAQEDRESYVLAGTDIKADFCLRAAGDSMIGARIKDGDIVFIRKQASVDNGAIAAVIIGDEATLKRVNYFPKREMLILKAENSKYQDMVFIGEELSKIQILGLAIAFQSDVI